MSFSVPLLTEFDHTQTGPGNRFLGNDIENHWYKIQSVKNPIGIE
jgi:hypothetical protein